MKGKTPKEARYYIIRFVPAWYQLPRLEFPHFLFPFFSNAALTHRTQYEKVGRKQKIEFIFV